jgi:hypothetical protein
VVQRGAAEVQRGAKRCRERRREVQRCRGAGEVLRCSGARCSGAQVLRCSGAQVLRCSGAQQQHMQRCSRCRGGAYVQVLSSCSGAVVQWCSGAVVQRYRGAAEVLQRCCRGAAEVLLRCC